MLYDTKQYPAIRDKWLEDIQPMLPHPVWLRTPKGFTQFGTMKTHPVRVMLYAAIQYPAFVPSMFELLDPDKLSPELYQVYEAITVCYESGQSDPIDVIRYLFTNYPANRFRIVFNLIEERDRWSLHEDIIENVIRQYTPA